MTVLTWDFDLLPVAGISHSLVGGAIEAPKSVSGITQVIDFSGGGFWKLDLKKVQLFADRDVHRAYLQMRGELDGGVGRVVVPLINDLVAPSRVSGITHSDGTIYDDGTSYYGSSTVAFISTAASVRATTVTIRVDDGEDPAVPDHFSIYHLTKGWCLYQIKTVDTIVTSGSSRVATVSIKPPLRGAVPSGAFCDFWRPRCTMRLPAGGTMPWDPEKWWVSTPTVSLIEAMD